MTVRRLATIGSWAAALLLAATPVAYADGYAGFRAGVHNASFAGADADEVPWTRTVFSGGGFIGFDSWKHAGFRAELLYTMKGANGDGVEFKIDYLELPLLFVGRYSLSSRYSLRAFAGPVIALWINAEVDDGPDDLDIGDIVYHWELSGTIGAEFNVRTGPYVLLLEARYTQGSRVFEDEDLAGDPLDFTVSNSGPSVMAGLMVPF